MKLTFKMREKKTKQNKMVKTKEGKMKLRMSE